MSSEVGVRDQSIDVAKGIAIVAIVFGHVWRGLWSAGLIADEATYFAVDTAVYMSHLTVFAFTAGLFVQRGMRREGPWAYTRNRDLDFLWLYLLWTAIQGAVKLAAASVVNSPVSVGSLLELWRPDGQLWFFGWIALMMVITAIARPWASRVRAIVSVSLVAGGSVAMWGLNGEVIGTQGLALSVFFIVAVLWRSEGFLEFAERLTWPVLASISLAGLAVMLSLALSGHATPPTTLGEERDLASVLLGMVASIAGLMGVLALSRLIGSARWARGLALLGRRSLVIFIAHIVFASGTRIVLSRLGIDDLALQILGGVLAGVAGPLLLSAVATRLRAGWLFSIPERLAFASTRGGRSA